MFIAGTMRPWPGGFRNGRGLESAPHPMRRSEATMKQVAVIGLGQFGMHLARRLVQMGGEVIAIDVNETRVDEIRDDVQRAIIGDARDFHTLDSALSSRADEVVVGLGEGSIEPSILCVVNLKRCHVKKITS